MTTKKQIYTVKLEALVPTELTFKVWAENPQQAEREFQKSGQLIMSKPFLLRKKNIKATIYKYGTMIIEFIKKY